MPATKDGNGYFEPIVIVTMQFGGKQQGLWVATKEPTAKQWKDRIIPLLQFKDEPLRFVEIFIELLDSWNLKHEDGTAVPCTLDGLMNHNIRIVNKIIKAWINGGIIVVEDDEEEAPESEEEEETEVDPFADLDLTVLEMPLPEEAKAVG